MRTRRWWIGVGSPYDVQFRNLVERYGLGVAVFDDTSTRHSFLAGPAWLEFAGRGR